jgi:hypothetical protein
MLFQAKSTSAIRQSGKVNWEKRWNNWKKQIKTDLSEAGGNNGAFLLWKIVNAEANFVYWQPSIMLGVNGIWQREKAFHLM